MSWNTFLKALLWTAGGLAGTVLTILIFFQEKLIYVPELPGLARGYPFKPDKFRMEFEDVWLESSDGVRLHAWLIKLPKDYETAPTMLLFQENAGNIAHRLEFVRYIMHYLKCNVFLLSYRGYGESGGSPSEWGIRRDAQAALDYVTARDDISQQRIVVFGRSLGGAVGARLVYENPDKVCCLIVENTFSSILDMAGVVLPPLKHVLGSRGLRPLNFVVRSSWRTIDVIGKINVPILMYSSEHDELVPASHMARLHEVAQKNKDGNVKFVAFPQGGHMDTWMQAGESYWRQFRLFIDVHSGRALSLRG